MIKAGVTEELIRITLNPFDERVAPNAKEEEAFKNIPYYDDLFNHILTNLANDKTNDCNTIIYNALWHCNHNSHEMFYYCKSRMEEELQTLEHPEKLFRLRFLLAGISLSTANPGSILNPTSKDLCEMLHLWLSVELENYLDLLTDSEEYQVSTQFTTTQNANVLACLMNLLHESRILRSEKPAHLFNWAGNHIKSSNGKHIEQEYFKKCFYTITEKSAKTTRDLLQKMIRNLEKIIS